VRLARNIGLEDLARRHVRVAAKVGANAGLKIGRWWSGLSPTPGPPPEPEQRRP